MKQARAKEGILILLDGAYGPGFAHEVDLKNLSRVVRGLRNIAGLLEAKLIETRERL